MHNFKIAHANLKDPNISSLRMNHFKIAHISTWLATLSTRPQGRNMEQEAVDYMLFLKQNASELRKLGSDWGMTDEEINGCIDEALSQVKSASKLKKNSTKNKARTIWSYILFMMKIPVYTILLVISLFLLVTIVSTVHEPTDKFISKVLQPLGYDIFRLIRIATLPIHRVANITSMLSIYLLAYLYLSISIQLSIFIVQSIYLSQGCRRRSDHGRTIFAADHITGCTSRPDHFFG